MAVDKLKLAAGNSSSTTLSSSVNNTDTSFPLTSDTNFSANGGMVIIDEGSSLEEFAYYTGKSGSSLTIPLANRGLEGSSAQAHSAGATVKGILSATMWNDMEASLENVLVKSTGAIDPTKVVTADSTTTFSNKRIEPRIVTAASYTTDTGTSLNCDTTDYFEVTAQSGDLKFNNPSGTPTNGQKLWIAVTGTGARALTYDTQFEASAAVALPTTTVTTARLDIGFVWRADTSKWRCVASA